MPHSYVHNLHHVVFSTKYRQPMIAPGHLDSVAAYIGGIARHNQMIAMGVSAMPDHVHILLVTPATMPIAKAVQLIKAGSSKWFRESHAAAFGWLEGYGAFTVSKSNERAVLQYIRTQPEHHKRRDFMAEFRDLLRLHGLELQPGDRD